MVAKLLFVAGLLLVFVPAEITQFELKHFLVQAFFTATGLWLMWISAKKLKGFSQKAEPEN